MTANTDYTYAAPCADARRETRARALELPPPAVELGGSELMATTTAGRPNRDRGPEPQTAADVRHSSRVASAAPSASARSFAH